MEFAGLDIIRLVQRSLGLTAFRAGTLTELLLRDLATYLRQPAPDIALDVLACTISRSRRWMPSRLARPSCPRRMPMTKASAVAA